MMRELTPEQREDILSNSLDTGQMLDSAYMLGQESVRKVLAEKDAELDSIRTYVDSAIMIAKRRDEARAERDAALSKVAAVTALISPEAEMAICWSGGRWFEESDIRTALAEGGA